MKVFQIAALSAAAALMLCGTALAAPIAPRAPLSKDGKQLYAYEHKTPKPCPDAAVVGLPAYPGALCLGMTTDVTKGVPASHRMYPQVVLVSSAPLAKVAAWYRAHLGKSWVYDPQVKHFTHPGWSIAHAMREPSVFLQPIDKMHQPFGAAFFVLGHPKTQISLRYKPKD